MTTESVQAKPIFIDGKIDGTKVSTPVPTPNNVRNSNSKTEQRRTNNEYRSSDKKVWDFLAPVSPDPFEPMHVWVVQRLLGDWGTPNVDGHNEDGWRPALEPAFTRVVYMKMLPDGQMVNVNSPTNKDRK